MSVNETIPAQSVTTSSAPAAAARQVAAPAQSHWFNVPNTLSMIRLIMAIGVGGLIELGQFTPAWIVFIVAASTDWIDGYWARRFNQVTKLGRILDPFVDKIIITAAMIALVGVPGSGVAAWMVTVIVGRELLVTSLRGMVEGAGGDFSARPLGKWKFLFQCIAVVACLILVSVSQPSPALLWTCRVALWVAVITTIASAVDYVLIVLQLARQKKLPAV